MNEYFKNNDSTISNQKGGRRTALVFDIEKFAVHDGPGIRTVVFLKGCPLVPGVNDSDEALAHIRRLSEETPGVIRVDIEPYHPMGEDKNRRLGRTGYFTAPFATDANKTRWRAAIGL